MIERNYKIDNKIFVTRSVLPEFEEYVEEIRDIWDSHWLTNMGKKHSEFENKLKELMGIQNISLTVNGHMALENIIKAMNNLSES